MHGIADRKTPQSFSPILGRALMIGLQTDVRKNTYFKEMFSEIPKGFSINTVSRPMAVAHVGDDQKQEYASLHHPAPHIDREADFVARLLLPIEHGRKPLIGTFGKHLIRYAIVQQKINLAQRYEKRMNGIICGRFNEEKPFEIKTHEERKKQNAVVETCKTKSLSRQICDSCKTSQLIAIYTPIACKPICVSCYTATGHANLDCLSLRKVWEPLFFKYHLNNPTPDKSRTFGYIKMDVRKNEDFCIEVTFSRV
ncbi:MAG: hypothetical protein Q8R26_02910, partial [bacterium]|nr:hypothetical protein [bacterium]